MTRDVTKKIFASAIGAVDPYHIVNKHIEEVKGIFSGEGLRQLVVVGFGKASWQMASAVAQSIDRDILTGGVVITKYGHVPGRAGGGRVPGEDYLPKSPDNASREAIDAYRDSGTIRIFEAGHPLPDLNGVKAAEIAVGLLRGCRDDALVLCLVSGGGSALLVSPYEGITLPEKQVVTDLLLRAGASIDELNTVRKHISRVKGGRLAEIAYPARVVSLVMSDVIGDSLEVIASGPTSPDATTFADALGVIKKYGLGERIPGGVFRVLDGGREGLVPETPKEGNVVFSRVTNKVIANNLTALNAARDTAREMGLTTEVLASDVTGEAREVGKWLAKKALGAGHSSRRDRTGGMCLISGGETTVTVRGSGKGGRNTELALSFAREIEGMEGVTLLSAGTDGTDGPTDAAGAIVDGDTVRKARGLHLDPGQYLDNNDSYNLFKQTDDLLITGPTGTNVMDIQILLIH